MKSEPSAAEIAAALRMDADRLARHLLPRGSYEDSGREWKCRGRNSPTGEAISVHVGHGAKRGVVGFWNGTRRGGDMLDLIAAVNGISNRAAVQWAKEWLGINRGTYLKHSTSTRETIERAHATVKKRQLLARDLWDGCGSLAGAASGYLRSRGLDPALADGELRSHPGLRHPAGGTFPALVGRVSNISACHVGIWRIFVKSDGSGKAPVDNPKLGLGDVKGGAVRIGGVWPEVGVAEGIETALACRQIIRNTLGLTIPVWAALSTSGMRGLELPPEVTSVRIFADADAVKVRGSEIKESPGLAAAYALEARLVGRAVSVEAPPTGMDWLDVLNATQGRAP